MEIFYENCNWKKNYTNKLFIIIKIIDKYETLLNNN